MPSDGDRSRRGPIPGDLLLQPVILVSLALLLLNDFYLKASHPGPVAWKLSDFAGLAFFPALLYSVTELVASAIRRRRTVLPRRSMWLFAAATATAFALVKLIPAVGDLAERANDVLVSSVAGGRGPTIFTTDPSDLWALPAVLVSVWVAYRARD